MKGQLSNPVRANAGYQWVVAYKATVLAGAIFGAIVAGTNFSEFGLIGALFAIFYGSCAAGLFALLVIPSFAALTWAFCVSRFANLTAILAGATTGVIATYMNRSPLNLFCGPGKLQSLLAIAGLLAASISGALTTLYMRKTKKLLAEEDLVNTRVFQFPLQSLFLRMTVVAVIVSAWAAAFAKYMDR